MVNFLGARVSLKKITNYAEEERRKYTEIGVIGARFRQFKEHIQVYIVEVKKKCVGKNTDCSD